MPKRTPPVFPASSHQLTLPGERVRAARLRRRMTQAAGERIAANTAQTEQGEASSSLATLVRGLQVPGWEMGTDVLTKDDEIGRRLQDIHQVGAPRSRPRKS